MNESQPTEQLVDQYDDEVAQWCSYCHGDGGDPWNDGILPCPRCDGMGYDWWN